YLQLGILRTERGNFEQAIRDYTKAIEVSPQLSEAHYRLGSAYRRISEESKAEQEFWEYEKIEKAETAAIERQRRELRQFLVIFPGPYTNASADGSAIALCADQLDLDPILLVAAIVAKQRRRVVHVQNQRVDIAIVVVIAEGRAAAGEALADAGAHFR